MTTYVPDKWVIVEVKAPEETLYKVLASWYGGYLGSDSWKLSSGITNVTKTEHGYEFLNHSGSIYKCHKEQYGMSMFTAGIYAGFEQLAGETIRLVDEQDVEKMTIFVPEKSNATT